VCSSHAAMIVLLRMKPMIALLVAKQRVDALLIGSDVFLSNQLALIVALVARPQDSRDYNRRNEFDGD
jgi:hypothetical protein